MSEDRMPDRPRSVTVLCGISLVFAAGFTLFAIYLLSQLMLRPAILMGVLPAIGSGAGAIGVLTHKEWGERALTGGLLVGGTGAIGATIFSALMIGEGSAVALLATVISAVVSIALIGLAFRFRGTDVRSYLMAVRMAQMDEVKGAEEPVVLDLSSSDEEDSEVVEESSFVEARKDGWS